MMDFYSHLKPEKILLKKHLQSVGNKSKEIILSKEFNEEMNKEIIADVSYLIGVSHDFGKYTKFFQDKLKYQIEKNDDSTFHGYVSALFTFEVVSEYIKTKKLEKEPYKFLPLIGYFVVKHHHGDLKALENDVNAEKSFEQFKSIPKQINNIEENKEIIIKEYSDLFKGYISVDVFKQLDKYKNDVQHSSDIKVKVKEISNLYYEFKKEKNIIYYMLTLLLYSVLIDSDKKHAGDVREIGRKELPLDLVDKYLSKEKFKKENKSKINNIREKIRESVIKKIKLIPIDYKIFTITAPTGTGKTLTSLSAALILRKRMKNELKLKNEPRIIYSLPFTSIIDQNYNVFDNVLQSSQINDFKEKESQYLLKHHHLSEIFYKTEDIDKEEEIEESLALIESWESEIVVTSFIQLFYALIGYKNRSLKKFHNIVNSIILLDEVQNIPIKYWSVTREILISMSKYFNCRIILMTATKPLIFKENEYTELLDEYENYFKCDELNRVVLKVDLEKKTIDEFCDEFCKELNNMPKNSYLFVFNTIQSSLDFYNLIRKRIQKLWRVYYLSTNIIPKERKDRIDQIKKSLNAIKQAQEEEEGKKRIDQIKKEKIIIVSTQLIEAGVDIDCDCVYRDMGPLDSIIQVAGRCNRNKRDGMGDMHLLNLINKEDKSFTHIYENVLIELSKKIFEQQNQNQIEEKKFLDLINRYFDDAKGKSSSETNLIDSLYKLYFYDKNFDLNKRTPISEFKLIEEEPYKVDVFVEVDDKAKDVWQKYNEIRNNNKLNGFEKKNEFLKIKKDFYDYVISVDEEKVKELHFLVEGKLLYISNKDLKLWYKADTGFDPSPDASFNSRCF